MLFMNYKVLTSEIVSESAGCKGQPLRGCVTQFSKEHSYPLRAVAA